MKRMIGQRVRCLSSDNIYMVVGQLGCDLVGEDEATGNRVALRMDRVVRNSPMLVLLGRVVNAITNLDYRALPWRIGLVVLGLSILAGIVFLS